MRFLKREMRNRVIFPIMFLVCTGLVACDQQEENKVATRLIASKSVSEVASEWAQTAEDILWRRGKLGLKFTKEQTNNLQQWLTASGV